MHYSPFAAGTGLFVVWYVAPAGSLPALIARFLIDCAGLVFVAILAFFLLTKHLGQLLARQHSTAPEWLTAIIQLNSKSGLVGSNTNAASPG